MYRGGHATDHYRARRVGTDGSLAVRVPISGELITVVSQYKHLGGITNVKDNNVPEARARVMAAMESYGPLAERIFGSPLVSMTARWSLLTSLVFSRLLFNLLVCDCTLLFFA